MSPSPAPALRPLPLILLLLAIMVGASLLMNRYSEQVMLPRYCDHPAQTLIHLHRLLTEREPAGEGAKRPYLIAAKLLYLLPRQSGESLDSYQWRLRGELEQRCRG